MVALWALAATPQGASALLGWSLTAKPLAVPAGKETDVQLRLSDTAAEFDIACLLLAIPEPMDVRDVDLVATSVSGEWDINASGGDPARVEVFDKDGDGALHSGDWVDFVVRVRPEGLIPSIWTGNVFADADCEGPKVLPSVVIEIVVLPIATPRPTATPSAVPTPRLTMPVPSSLPSVTPTLPPTALPTLPPTVIPTRPPTATPTLPPIRTPSPSPTPTQTAALTPSPSATTAAGPTPSPQPVAAPTDTPDTGAPDSSPGRSTEAPGVVPPVGPAAPPDPEEPAPSPGYELPDSLYDLGDTSVSVQEPSSTWIIPALVTGVPGLLVLVLVIGHIFLGLSWLPGVGRLLGPTPEEVDDRRHVWWAAGRPIN